MIRGDNEGLKKFIKEALEGMKKHFIQGFEFLASQRRGKSTPESCSSSPHDEKRTNGKPFFQRLDLITDPMNSRIRLNLRYLSF